MPEFNGRCWVKLGKRQCTGLCCIRSHAYNNKTIVNDVLYKVRREAQEQFWDPKEGERPPLEAVTRGLAKSQQTEMIKRVL
jgi:hypothetical protein